MPNRTEVVHAEPTKSFFISMLVRDIGLVAAIVDLVDNCVDGARRLRPARREAGDNGHDEVAERFKGLWVNVRTSKTGFEVNDNCGGIPWNVAQDYAFRFGRPDEAPATPDSIGQFGIGMKRALFKMGENFTVESNTKAECFKLHVDVNLWRSTDEWVFNDVSHSPLETPPEETGTRIQVSSLYDEISGAFTDTQFQNRLTSELKRSHQATIASGLALSLNGIPIDVQTQELLNSKDLRPAYATETLQENSDNPVHVQLITGVGTSSPSEAGWYVYCNGRLILGPDRSVVTGWGEGKGRTIPQYHNQFSRFRGYLFFECADVRKLPWTTTKSGIDADHRTFTAVRPRLLEAMRPVIDFLNALDAEKDEDVASEFLLEKAVVSAERSGLTSITQLQQSARFISPQRVRAPRKPSTQSIQYQRPISEIKAVKDILSVNSAREVGERTFDYFYRRECSDE